MLQDIVALAPFVPLLQTLLWISLVIALTLWFNKPIRSLLAALRQRVEAGSSVKAGWFELSELKPESAEQQRERAKLELTTTLAGQTTPSAGLQVNTQTLGTPPQALLAEDLALRAIQADRGVPLNRQISAGPDAGFDGAFAQDGKLNIVEVKFFTGEANPNALRTSLERLASAVERVHWRNVRIILVLVFQRHEDVYLPKEPIDKALEGFRLPVEIKTYSLPELRKRFGVAPGDA